MNHNQVPKRVKNAIVKRIEQTIKKYGIETVRCVSNHYFLNYRERLSRQKEIDKLTAEIQELKKKQK